MKRKIILASGNLHKIQEIRDMLKWMEVEVLSKKEIGCFSDVEETGTTLEENSLLKARNIHRETGFAALADDSGIFVRALKWAPGVFSARFAGNTCNDEENNRLLLKKMENVLDRYAEFRCVLSFVTEDGTEHTFSGVCSGSLLLNTRGEHGFGYDPLFVPCGYSMTFAELSGSEKNRISHRSLALQKFVDFLRNTCYADLRLK